MRALLLAALLMLAPAVAPTTATAQSLTDEPEVYVASVYGLLLDSKPYETPDALYTPRLRALWKDMRKDAGDEVGRVNFFFWTNSQDGELSNFRFEGEPVSQNDNRRIVIAKFRNTDRDEVIVTYWEKLDGRWRLDDVQSQGKHAWTLSVILKYGWVGED